MAAFGTEVVLDKDALISVMMGCKPPESLSDTRRFPTGAHRTRWRRVVVPFSSIRVGKASEQSLRQFTCARWQGSLVSQCNVMEIRIMAQREKGQTHYQMRIIEFKTNRTSPHAIIVIAALRFDENFDEQ